MRRSHILNMYEKVAITQKQNFSEINYKIKGLLVIYVYFEKWVQIYIIYILMWNTSEISSMWSLYLYTVDCSEHM